MQGDHEAAAEALRAQLGAGGPTGVVVLAGPRDGDADETSESAARGGDYVAHVVRIARELAEVDGASPRLYVVTRNAQRCVPEDCPNLEQGGLRGLLRVIGTENPHLRTTHIDVDEQTDVERLARQLLGGVRRGRDRVAQRRAGTRRG